MDAKQFVLSRLLPKTSQTEVYFAGDDGSYQSGWWKGRKIAGNKTRFLSKTINGDDIVLDLATGLIWPANGNAAGCNNGGAIVWEAGITYAGGLNFAGFTDWRMPNILELISLIDFTEETPVVYTDYFSNISASAYWTSTADARFTYWKWNVEFNRGTLDRNDRVALYKLWCVRGGV